MGFMAPKPPAPPPLPPPLPEPDNKEIEAAKKAEEKRIRKMKGRAYTIKTGAGGDKSEAQVKKKTLLGE
jgi:hypothetical protein